MTEIIDIDHHLLLLVNGMHTDYLDQLMWLISGKLVWIPFYMATLYCVWKNVGTRQTIVMLLMIGVMMLFTDTLNASVIRPWIGRLRPANLDSPVGSMVHVVNDYRGGMFGFPSAHAANYCGLSFIVAYFMRSRKVLWAMLSLTVVVCYSRSYLGVHYPGDLMAGMLYASIVSAALIFMHQRWCALGKNDERRLEWGPAAAALGSLVVFSLISYLG